MIYSISLPAKLAMPSRFEANFADPQLSYDPFIDEVFSELKSAFLVMPKGEGFVDYPTFEAGYQLLKRSTQNFETVSVPILLDTIYSAPITLVVLRTILGFTPPEWAYVATERTGVEVGQNAARGIDRKVRVDPFAPMRDRGSVTDRRIQAMVVAAVQCLDEDRGDYDRELFLHRLDKFDTAEGTRSLRPLADLGVPYAALLYERFMGRPFAGHRDAVSGLVGDVVESAVEAVLASAGVSNRKTKRAERIVGQFTPPLPPARSTSPASGCCSRRPGCPAR
jgi:hypothetical protein